MLDRPLVLRSIETLDGQRCVDIFRRPDGSFGFEFYRRDVEDASGWFPIGSAGGEPYPTEASALDAALLRYPWLGELAAMARYHHEDPWHSLNWSKAAKDYATHLPGPPPSFYRRLETLGVGLKGQRVLDMGTGPGQLALQFARQGGIAAGIDLAAGQVEAAQAQARLEGLAVDFRVSPAEQTPFADGSFDAITANHCWIYFDSKRALAEVKRLLVPGGQLCISFFSWLAVADEVVRRTEQLILEFNPKFTHAGWSGVIPPEAPWVKDLATQKAMFWYDEAVPFTHESWRGRVRANCGVGPSLPPGEVQRFDAALAERLRTAVPDPFTVVHRISAYFVVPK